MSLSVVGFGYFDVFSYSTETSRTHIGWQNERGRVGRGGGGRLLCSAVVGAQYATEGWAERGISIWQLLYGQRMSASSSVCKSLDVCLWHLIVDWFYVPATQVPSPTHTHTHWVTPSHPASPPSMILAGIAVASCFICLYFNYIDFE